MIALNFSGQSGFKLSLILHIFPSCSTTGREPNVQICVMELVLYRWIFFLTRFTDGFISAILCNNDIK